MIVSQLHCELPCLHCSQCLPLLSSSQPFPGSLPLGSAWIKNGHKKATTSKYWLGLRTAALSQRRHRAPERPPLFRSYSAAHSRLFSCAERQAEGKEETGEVAVESVHKWSEVGQGEGGYSWRDSTVSGVRETSALEARGCCGGNGVQAAESWGGVRTRVSTLRKCQSQKASKRADWMWFPVGRVQKLSIKWG